jgi:hypothetical protein
VLNNADNFLPGSMARGENIHNKDRSNDSNNPREVAVVCTKDVWIVDFNQICQTTKDERSFISYIFSQATMKT